MESTLANDLRVLVAEDESGARELISAVFDTGGWGPPVTARNGVEALERLGEDHYDILVTDLNMPRLGGEELVRRALRSDPDLTVIVLSGNGTIPKAMHLMRGIGFTECKTSRSESKSRDDAGVDLVGTGCLNVQAKRTQQAPNFQTLLASMPDEPGQHNVVFHKRKLGRSVAVMDLADFAEIVETLIKEGIWQS